MTDSFQNKSPVIPFGKYKGQPAEVLQNDPEYCNWLAAQPWFRDRYMTFYTLIVNNFAAGDDSPEHNRLQARFLDEEFLWKFAIAFTGRPVSRSKLGTPRFEVKGADVVVGHGIRIECKPFIGDDYPTILRQMKAIEACCLVVHQYVGDGVEVNVFQRIFENENITVLFEHEIDSIEPTEPILPDSDPSQGQHTETVEEQHNGSSDQESNSPVDTDINDGGGLLFRIRREHGYPRPKKPTSDQL